MTRFDSSRVIMLPPRLIPVGLVSPCFTGSTTAGTKVVKPSACDRRQQGIALYLPQRPGAVRGGCDALGGTVVPDVNLGAVSAQEKPAQIGRPVAHECEQFRGGGTGGALPAVRLKFQAWPALEKRGGHRGQPAAAKRGMFRWLEDSIQRRRFFGGIRVALMGAGTARKFVLFFRIY